MNHCMLMAEITAEPQLRHTQDNTPITEFTISFPGLRDDDATQQMQAIGWGNLAQELQEQYRIGDRVLLEGRLTMKTVDRPEGFKEKQAEMTVQKIHRLTELGNLTIAPTATAPSAPVAPVAPVTAAVAPSAGTTTAAEPEVDYDDIPF